MKKIYFLLAVLLSVSFTQVTTAQVLYGDKYLDKTSGLFAFTNEPFRTSPWGFDCFCGNSCQKEWWKFYKAKPTSPAGLVIQDQVVQFGQLSLFRVNPAGSIPNTYLWKHIGRKYGQPSGFCASCECWVDPIAGEDFNIIIADFSWKSTTTQLTYICKSTATTIDLKDYLNYYDASVIFTGAGVNGVGILNVSSLAPGSYTVTAERQFDNIANGGNKVLSLTFTVVDFNPIVTASPATATVCDGNAVTLNSTVTGDTYQWYRNGTLIVNANQQSYGATTSGNYTVAVTVNGCTKTSTAIVVTVNPSPNATINPSGNVFLCTGQTITLTSSAVSGNVWSTGQTTQSIIVNTAGSYTVTQTNGSGCSATSIATNIIDVGNTPASITSDISPDICAGSTVTLSVTSSADTYQWYKNGTLIPGATQISYATTTAGDYYCVVVAGSCTSTSNHIIVTIKSSPTPSIASNVPGVPCEGTPVTLTVTPAAQQYSWSNGVNAQSTTVSTGGNYSVTVTYANGCTNNANYNLVYNANPQPSISNNTATEFCQGGNVVLTSSTSTGSYQWFRNGVDLNSNTQNYTATLAGTYTVKTIQSNGCNSTSNGVIVTVYPKPTAIISNITGISCNNSPVTLQATSNAVSPTYLWNYNSQTTQQITVTTPGVYTCTITDGNGCFNSATYNLTSTTLVPPDITPGGPTTFCMGGVVTLTSSYTTGNSWYKDGQALNQTSQSITVSQAGSYYVTTTAGACSASSTTLTIIINPTPTAEITVSGPLTWCEGSGSASTLTSNLEAGYQWYLNGAIISGATQRNYIPLLSGSYTVETRNVFNCYTISAAVNIVVKPNPQPVITLTGQSTICPGDSTILTSSFGSDYSWNTGATTQSITVRNTGNYNVTVTHTNGCINTSANQSITVLAGTPASITPNGATTFCDGGSVLLTSSLSTGNYQWFRNGVDLLSNTQTYTAILPGNYTVRVSLANGCTSTSAATVVNVNPKPTATISNLTGGSCNNSPVTLQANTNAVSPSYLWSYNNLTTQQISVTTAGVYTCTITDVNGCINTATYNLTTTTFLPPTITADGTTTFCDGGVRTLTSSYATGNSWYKDGQALNQTSQAITVSTAGSYYVISTNGTCTATSTTTTIIINPIPDAEITANGPLAWCENTQAATVLTSNLETGYQWYNNGTIIPGATLRNYTPSASGAYTVETRNFYNCKTVSPAVVVTVKNNPIPPITLIGASTFCTGDSAILVTASGASDYLWSNGSTVSSTVARNTGIYNCTVTYTNGCTNVTPNQSITVLANIPALIQAGSPTEFCTGDNVELTASPGGVGYTYLWSNGATTQNISVTTSGTYWCTVSKGGCTKQSNSILVTVYSKPIVNITGGGSTVCAGSHVVLRAISNQPNMTWIWNTGQTTDTIHATTAGPFYVIGYNQFNCNTQSSSVTVNVVSEPVPTITNNTSLSFCQGGSVLLTSSLSTGTYTWYKNGVPLNISTRSYLATTAGAYTVKVTSSIGCSNTSDEINVVVFPLEIPTITVTGSTTLCQGQSVLLTASAASGYLWSTGETTPSITVSTSSTVTVTTTSVNGCVGTSQPMVITVRPIITPTISLPNGNQFCDRDSILAVSSAGLSYLWSNGATTQQAYYTTGGNITVTVLNANGCQGTSLPTPIIMKANPIPTITASRDLFLCDTPSLYLTSSIALNYSWNPGSATTRILRVPSIGDYDVTVTNTNGCVAKSATVTVEQGITETVQAIGTKRFCVDAGVQTFTFGTPTGGYFTGPGISAGNTFNPAAAGVGTHQINYNVISVTGCLTYTTFNVIVTPKIIWQPKADTSICVASGLYDLFNATMPISLTTYSGNGVTGRFFNPATAGVGTHVIAITVNDTLGCIETKYQNIVVFERPTAPVITGNTFGCKNDMLTLAASSSAAANAYKWFYLGNPVPFATTQTVQIPLINNTTKVYVIAYNQSGNTIGCSSPSSDTVLLEMRNPSGDFYADFTSIPWGGLVKFNSVITNGFLFNWKFGDSSYSSQRNPSHYYYREGKFDVTLKVTSPEGCITTITKPLYITVGTKPIDTIDVPLPINPVDNKNPYQVNLFPNPFSENLYVTFHLLTANQKVSVIAYNQKGDVMAIEEFVGQKGNNKVQLKKFFGLVPQTYYIFKVSINNADVYFKQIRIKK